METGILPEPHVTSAQMQNDQLRAALDVTELFEDAARAAGKEDMVLSMGCVIVRREYAQSHPDQVSAFMDAYAASVEFVNTDVSAAAQQVEAFGIMPKAAAAGARHPQLSHRIHRGRRDARTDCAAVCPALRGESRFHRRCASGR